MDPPRRRSYSGWRAGTLIGVHVLIAIHITHWLLAGKTLAPLELNEVMYTAELGIITAGFLFMLGVFLASAVFGRFFCSWGCHILALQDLSAWILRKMHIKPRPIRSRALAWVPVLAAFYMFIWPQMVRLWEGRAMQALHTRTDQGGWASFVTENFWRNLPTPAVIAVTFTVVGFLSVYVFGSRAFCTYGCPYGALFRLADRIAPGRIRTRAKDCLQCGACTAACTSHVRVHEELSRFGMVVNPACLKDLDCVAACPQQRVYYGFGKLSALKSVQLDVPVLRTYDFTLAEELLLSAVFVLALIVYRGLYDFFPFLMTLALAGIAGYSAVVFMRMVRHAKVRFNRWPLKTAGRYRSAAAAFVPLSLIFALLTVHSAFIRYHSLLARRGEADSSQVIAHLETARKWGLLRVEREDAMLAQLYEQTGQWANAVSVAGEILSYAPDNPGARLIRARALLRQGRLAEASKELGQLNQLSPPNADVHYAMAGGYFELGDRQAAVAQLLEAIRLRPQHAMAHYDLGALLLEVGDLPAGVEHLRRAVELRPEFADAHHNLAIALAQSQDLEGALRHARRARQLSPGDEHIRGFLGELERFNGR